MKTGIYILKCSNGRFYIGSTNNIDRRIEEHKNGQVIYTKNILPVKLLLFHPCTTIKEARQIEYKLKRLKNRTIIEKIVQDGTINMRP
ncbi:MAG: GIY-YIG nuclease family protein [Candidatus Spechtbacterales bacterium]